MTVPAWPTVCARRWHATAPGRGGCAAALDEVARWFDRFACVMVDRPATSEGVPENADFALALWVVREAIHHVGYAQLRVP